MIEPGVGNYPGSFEGFSAAELANSPNKRDEFVGNISCVGLGISALSCHGNALHADKEFAAKNDQVQRDAIRAASAMSIQTVNTFSGCPGSDPTAQLPSWATCAWPPDYEQTLKYQWELAVKYWIETAKFAADHNVRVAFEMHPGFLVYNVASMMAMREECGPAIGCNFDPSHLIWNGVDVCLAARTLADAGAIFHVHAKDVKIDKGNTAINGCNNSTPYADRRHRSWDFCTVGYGDVPWPQLIRELALGGYQGAVSIEHEDGLMSIMQGLGRAVTYLDGIMITEDARKQTWA